MSSPLLTDRSTTVFKTPTSSRCSSQQGGGGGGGAWTTPATDGGRTSTTTPAAHTSVGRTPRRPVELRTPRSRKRTPGGDRFIPSRAGADLQFSSYKVRSAKRRRRDATAQTPRAENGSLAARTPLTADPDSARRREKLFALRGRSSESRILNLRQITASGSNPNDCYWKDYSLTTSTSTSARRAVRKYPKTADKILDAPNLIDDFYLNLMDWSKRGVLAIALGSVVYLLNADTSDSSSLCGTGSENTYISSLQWNKTGQYLAIGTSNADVQLWDVDTKKLVRSMHTHNSRVNSLAWNPRSHLLSSASQSGTIHNYDVRQPQFHVASLDGRSRDICGLQWSPSGRFLASGGDGNVVCLWDSHTRDPWSCPTQILREHSAAVKALSWCPWQSHLLASGGGSADQHICLWNACTGQLLDKIHTGSQISGLVWSAQHRELLSSHGHPHNELLIWSYPSLSRCASLRGHQGRILHLAHSPDRDSIASVGADETLRIWKCFAAAPGSKDTARGSVSETGGSLLRPEPLEMPGYIL